MTAATLHTGILTGIAGQPVPQLAKQFGTPSYIYDAAQICQRIADLAEFYVVRYAQKSCSNLAILDLVRRNGVLIDGVSAGEIHRAIAAGYKPGQKQHPPEIVYTADIFDRETLEIIEKHDIHVNCGSPDMIDQYGERMPGRGITLRINPGFGHGHSQKTNTGGSHSKHGIWHEQIEDCIERATKSRLTIRGLHVHIGSGTDMEHLSQVCGAMEQACLSVGASIHAISAGGGIPTPYRTGEQRADLSGYFELWNSARQRLAKAFGHHVSLEIEPGRYLVSESGALIAEIRAVKQMGDNLFYLLDAGFNNLARPILYGAYHPMAVCYVRGEGRGASSEKDAQQVIVGGPLCESGDIFTQEDGGYVRSRELPVASVGDFLVIGVAGAYGAVMGSNYNTKPLAAEVLVEDGKAHLVRERQSFDDIVRGERIPKA